MEQQAIQIQYVIVTAIVTGGFSTAATVIALRVHIAYIKEALTLLRTSLDRAHRRIDNLNSPKPTRSVCND